MPLSLLSSLLPSLSLSPPLTQNGFLVHTTRTESPPSLSSLSLSSLSLSFCLC